MLPLAMLVTVLVLQGAAIAVAVSTTSEAVRVGALALSQGGDGCVAARQVLGPDRDMDCVQTVAPSGRGSRVSLTVDIPVAPGLRGVVPDLRVIREADMP